MRNLLRFAAVTAGVAVAVWLWSRPVTGPPAAAVPDPGAITAAPPEKPPAKAPPPAPDVVPPAAPPLAAGFCDGDDSKSYYEIKHTLRGLLRKSPEPALLEAPLDAAEAAARKEP